MKNKSKDLIIEELKKMPIIQMACKKAGVSRASYYRWVKESSRFAKQVEKAIEEGENLINDMSESQLISLIRNKNFQALKLWLNHHHPKYNNKVEVTGHFNVKEEPLTSEQEALIEKALSLGGLLENKQVKQKHEKYTPKLTE